LFGIRLDLRGQPPFSATGGPTPDRRAIWRRHCLTLTTVRHESPRPNQITHIARGSSPPPASVPATRFLEFFAANIRNPHTRRAYSRAVGDFLAWCTDAGMASIAVVTPLHVATWIEAQTRELSAPTVKQRLAALRHLFDWLVTGQVVPANPAASVRGPSHIVKSGKTPVLDPAEARASRKYRCNDAGGPARPSADRLMVYSFARIGI
jgi:hypothetical protein